MSSGRDFQSGNSRKGQEFRAECERILRDAGFTLNSTGTELDDIGVTVELIYDNRQGVSFFIEVCGNLEDKPGERPGFMRSDSVRKVLSNAFLVHRHTGYSTLALTSHVPNPNTAPAKMLNGASRDVVFDVICTNNPDDLERLREYARMTGDQLQSLSSTQGEPIIA